MKRWMTGLAALGFILAGAGAAHASHSSSYYDDRYDYYDYYQYDRYDYDRYYDDDYYYRYDDLYVDPYSFINSRYRYDYDRYDYYDRNDSYYDVNCGRGEYRSGGRCRVCYSKPSDAYYTRSGSCDWQCESGYTRSGDQCIYRSSYRYNDDYYDYDDDYYYSNSYYNRNYNNNYTYVSGNRCGSSVVCGAINGRYQWYDNDCDSRDRGATIVNNTHCETNIYNYNYNNNNYYHNNCANGATNYPYCTICGAGQTMISGQCTTSYGCPTLPQYAYWLGGHGNNEPNCEWRCQSGYSRSGNICVADRCDNGATNYPFCNSCPSGQIYQNGQCVFAQSCGSKPTNSTWVSGHGHAQPNCQWNCNAGYHRSGYTCVPSTCNNGATNYPNCNICPSGQTLVGNSCSTQTYSWHTGSYGSCSVSCGGGTQTRTITCRNQHGSVVSDSLCSGSRPSSTRSCNTHSCPQTPIHGSCGSSVNSCISGAYQDLSDTSSAIRWRCVGQHGGHTQDCSQSITPTPTPINGVCGGSQNSCAAGTFQDRSNTSTHIRWSCVGQNGGSTASCSSVGNTNPQPTCGRSTRFCYITAKGHRCTTPACPTGCRADMSQITAPCYTNFRLENGGLSISGINTCGGRVNLHVRCTEN